MESAHRTVITHVIRKEDGVVVHGHASTGRSSISRPGRSARPPRGVARADQGSSVAVTATLEPWLPSGILVG